MDTKLALVLAGAILLSTLIYVLGTENAFESCVEFLQERDLEPLLCAPGLAR